MQESTQQQRRIHRRSLQCEDSSALPKNIRCNSSWNVTDFAPNVSAPEQHEMPIEKKKKRALDQMGPKKQR